MSCGRMQMHYCFGPFQMAVAVVLGEEGGFGPSPNTSFVRFGHPLNSKSVPSRRLCGKMIPFHYISRLCLTPCLFSPSDASLLSGGGLVALGPGPAGPVGSSQG